MANKGNNLSSRFVGIDISHPTFGDRASWGFTADGLTDGDVHGHGTHCSGTVGGADYGVVKNTNLVAVKVINK